jgi:hypothetical protein
MKSDYAPVNGLKVYYEIHGANPARPPLVLLHGGGDTIKSSFGHILPELARNRQVIAFEQVVTQVVRAGSDVHRAMSVSSTRLSAQGTSYATWSPRVGHQSRHAMILAFEPVIPDGYVPATDVTRFSKPVAERIRKARQSIRRPAIDEPDHRHRRLLRARRKRPRYRAAEQRG